MVDKETDPLPGNTHYRYRLRSLFILTTVVAYMSGLAHYLGGMVLLRHVLFSAFTILFFLTLIVAPLLIVERLSNIADPVFGFSKTPATRRRGREGRA